MLVVVKPSCSRDITEHVKWLEKEVSIRQLHCHWFYTTGQFENDVAAIQNLLGEVSMIVAIGGDGTLHLLANALANTDVAVAILPAGTGNDFARQFNFTLKQWRALVFSGRPYSIDLGKINNRFFINIAGVGFNAAVVEDMDTFQSRHKFSYIFAGIKHLISFKQISANDRSLMHIFANGKFFAAGLKAAPNAQVDNGELLMVQFKANSLLSRVWTFLLMLFYSHERSQYVCTESISEFFINEPDLLIEADGEIVGQSPALIKVCPAALKVKL